jgi:hypothetical protein
LADDVNEKLNDYTIRIKNRIEDNFYEFDNMLTKEGQTIDRVVKVQDEIKNELKQMK